MVAYEILAGGLVLLALGGEGALRGMIGLSRIAGISPLLIGLVIVGFGSVAPEFFLAMQAAGRGAADLALGTIAGVGILNLLLVLGLSAVFRSVPAAPKVVLRDGGTMLAASLAFVLVARSGHLSLPGGLGLLAALLLYVLISFVSEWRRPVAPSLAERRTAAGGRPMRGETAAILLVLGLVCLFFGARFTVDGALATANTLHVPLPVAGLTIVATGVVLPTLLATLGTIASGTSIGVAGQLLGKNTFNLLFVLGVLALRTHLSIAGIVADAACYILLAASGFVVAMMMPGWRVTRAQGVLLLVAFAGYAVFLAWHLGLAGF